MDTNVVVVVFIVLVVEVLVAIRFSKY